MYQTVGQDAIELVAQALEVPLYRGFISGSAINQGSEYGTRSANHKGGTKGDETEDLFELLSIVKVCPLLSDTWCALANGLWDFWRQTSPISKASQLGPFFRTIRGYGLNMCEDTVLAITCTNSYFISSGVDDCP